MTLRFIRWRCLGHLLILHGYTGLKRLRDSSPATCPAASSRKRSACTGSSASRPESSDDAMIFETTIPVPIRISGDVTAAMCCESVAMAPKVVQAPCEGGLPGGL